MYAGSILTFSNEYNVIKSILKTKNIRARYKRHLKYDISKVSFEINMKS